MIPRLALVGLFLYACSAHGLESLGWKGFVSGCGINQYWTVGSFEKAKDVQDACQQAGKDHAKRPGGKSLTVHGCKGSLIEYVNARCYFEPNNGMCGLIQASPQCSVGSDFVLEAEACFCGAAAKEAGNKCVPGVDCDEMVRRLKQLKIQKSDSRYGFYRNQTCIAGKACATRSGMDDKEWLNKVVPDFVNPLIQKSGGWNRVMEGCKFRGMLPGLGAFWCQNEMANYHMQADLQKALNRQGCGTESDWKKVGDAISLCVEKGIKEDWPTSILQEETRDFANDIVQHTRNNVRATCLKQKR